MTIFNVVLVYQFQTNEPTPTQGYGVSMGNNLMIDSRVGELISLRDSITVSRLNFFLEQKPFLSRRKACFRIYPKTTPYLTIGSFSGFLWRQSDSFFVASATQLTKQRITAAPTKKSTGFK